MEFALPFLSLIAVVIACIGIIAVIFGIFAIFKSPSITGKIGIVLSIIIILASTTLSIILLIKSQQADLQESLFQAAVNGNSHKVKDLVAKGANINKKNQSGYTLLHTAIESGSGPMLDALLAGNPDVNIKNTQGLTPMQLLLDRSVNPWLRKKNFDYEAAAKQLLSHGATFNFQYTDGHHKTCVQQAISNNQNKMLKLMLDNGADVNTLDKQGSYLHLAIRKKVKIYIVETLLSAGADVNTRDSKGNTPLHEAAYFGREDIVQALLQHRADINARNNKGMTALDIAKNSRGNFLGNRKEVIEFLQQQESTRIEEPNALNIK